MSAPFERRDLTELRLRSTIFEITVQVAKKSRSTGLIGIQHDGGSLQVPLADAPELASLIMQAVEASKSPDAGTQVPLRPSASHPAGKRREGTVIPFGRGGAEE